MCTSVPSKSNSTAVNRRTRLRPAIFLNLEIPSQLGNTNKTGVCVSISSRSSPPLSHLALISLFSPTLISFSLLSHSLISLSLPSPPPSPLSPLSHLFHLPPSPSFALSHLPPPLSFSSHAFRHSRDGAKELGNCNLGACCCTGGACHARLRSSRFGPIPPRAHCQPCTEKHPKEPEAPETLGNQQEKLSGRHRPSGPAFPAIPEQGLSHMHKAGSKSQEKNKK